jgi:hypothetical protein
MLQQFGRYRTNLFVAICNDDDRPNARNESWWIWDIFAVDVCTPVNGEVGGPCALMLRNIVLPPSAGLNAHSQCATVAAIPNFTAPRPTTEECELNPWAQGRERRYIVSEVKVKVSTVAWHWHDSRFGNEQLQCCVRYKQWLAGTYCKHTVHTLNTLYIL